MSIYSLTEYFSERSVPQIELAHRTQVPRRFDGPISEHEATRHRVALFDFSFMSHFAIAGPQATAFVERLQVRAVGGRPFGRILYTVMCREDGTVLSDATIWAHGNGRYWLFTGRRSDRSHIAAVAKPFDVTVDDCSGRYAVIALQGPLSTRLLACAGATAGKGLRYFRFAQTSVAAVSGWVGRIGYTGEHGYELLVDTRDAVQIWEHLLRLGSDLGVAEAGFEAANGLRVEAGYILFDRELRFRVTPAGLGYGRLVDSGSAAPFLGASELRLRRGRALGPRLVGLCPLPSAAREFLEPMTLPDSETPPVRPGWGCLTSACWSPLFGRPLGMGYVYHEDHYPGTTVTLQNGQRARVARLPYYDPARAIPAR